MNYINITSIAVVFFTIATCMSCTKKEIKPELQDNNSTVIKDLPGDVGNTVGSGKEFEPFYFSFKTGAKVDPVKVNTTEWDIAFTKEYNSLIVVNGGGFPATPGYGGAGQGSLLIIEKPYGQVSEAPTAAEFATGGRASAGWDSGNGEGWFFYDLKTHIAVPVKNRTFALRTAEGKYAKLELISMYKGAPTTVSDLNWPAPYFTFRYFVQEDGSRNLNTQ